eukprot:405329-Rhodomonas_salina.1
MEKDCTICKDDSGTLAAPLAGMQEDHAPSVLPAQHAEKVDGNDGEGGFGGKAKEDEAEDSGLDQGVEVVRRVDGDARC